MPSIKVVQDIKEQDLYSEGEVSKLAEVEPMTFERAYDGVFISKIKENLLANENKAKEEREMRENDEAFQAKRGYYNFQGHCDGYWKRVRFRE